MTCYIRNHFENIENEVKRSLKITEIAMEKELAVIEVIPLEIYPKQIYFFYVFQNFIFQYFLEHIK